MHFKSKVWLFLYVLDCFRTVCYMLKLIRSMSQLWVKVFSFAEARFFSSFSRLNLPNLLLMVSCTMQAFHLQSTVEFCIAPGGFFGSLSLAKRHQTHPLQTECKLPSETIRALCVQRVHTCFSNSLTVLHAERSVRMLCHNKAASAAYSLVSAVSVVPNHHQEPNWAYWHRDENEKKHSKMQWSAETTPYPIINSRQAGPAFVSIQVDKQTSRKAKGHPSAVNAQ